MHDASHAGRYGNVVTVNGRMDARLAAAQGERLRLRLVNVATDRIFDLRFRGLKVWLAALDGMPLAAPQAADAVVLGPSQRADLIVDVLAEAGGEALIASVEGGEAYALVSLPVTGAGRAQDAAPAPLEANRVAPLALEDAVVRPMTMQGGAMRWLSQAMHEGQMLDTRALAERGQVWAFNGIAGMPEKPLAAVAVGKTVRIPIANDTAFPHAIHLHGHHFHVMEGEGPGPLRDTVLVQPGEAREIAFVADNPGRWMLHCHMLSHQGAGMMSWIEVG
jgi:FtsP/CotA-like multicopper oxidase with cupredoxin domain